MSLKINPFASKPPTAPTSPTTPLSALPTPPPLTPQTKLLLALSALYSTTHPAGSNKTQTAFFLSTGKAWLTSVCKAVELDRASLPPAVEEGDVVKSSSSAYWAGLGEEERHKEWEGVVLILLLASVFAEPSPIEEVKKVSLPPSTKESPTSPTTTPTLSYTPLSRSFIYSTLNLLSIPPTLLTPSEHTLSLSLFSLLQQSTAPSQSEIESTRAASANGWGGLTGRRLATGLGVLAGGIAMGITGGLAAPLIVGLLPGFMSVGILSAATAPAVVGTLFGLGGGRLVGGRVGERWKGVGEFEFVDVSVGSEESVDEKTEEAGYEAGAYEVRKKRVSGEEGRGSMEDQTRKLSLEAPEETVVEEKEKVEEKEEKIEVVEIKDANSAQEDTKELLEGKPPSLVATIVVPGLLTQSPLEAIKAYRTKIVPHSFSDSRDVYVLKFETKFMLSTGKAIDSWVTGKLKGYVKKEVIKRTVLSAYFAAVALPLSVYSMASMGLDNTWMQSQDKAKKAGRLLGEVLEKRVQGQRPVVLVGSSLGALTVLHALLYLSSLPSPKNLPQIIESAHLISLPSAPTAEEWAAVRGVVARRVVNAWCGSDLVLAGVVRLHEVVSRATTLSSGIRVAGLGPVEQPGIEDVDVSSVLDGHMQLQAKMGDILDIIKVDE